MTTPTQPTPQPAGDAAIAQAFREFRTAENYRNKVATFELIERRATEIETARAIQAGKGEPVEPEPFTNMFGNFSGEQYELLNGRQARVTYDRGRKVFAVYSNSTFWKEVDAKAFYAAATAVGAASIANFHYPKDDADYMKSPRELAGWMLIHYRAKFPTPELAAIYQMLKDLADEREAALAGSQATPLAFLCDCGETPDHMPYGYRWCVKNGGRQEGTTATDGAYEPAGSQGEVVGDKK